MMREKNLETVLTISTGLLVFYLIYKVEELIIISVVLGIIGIFFNFMGSKISWLWYKIAEVLGFIVSRILLTVVFYLLLFPIARLSRLFTKDPLCLSKNRDTLYTVRNANFSKGDFEKTW